MPTIYHIIIVIFFSSFKFALTFPFAIATMGFGFWQTVLWTNVGGLIGIYVFSFLSEQILSLWRKVVPHTLSGEKKSFTTRNRRIVRIKRNYGQWGIALTTPVILSIPVGAFLMVRYYSRSNHNIYFLALANLVWSLIYASFYFHLDQLVFG